MLPWVPDTGGSEARAASAPCSRDEWRNRPNPYNGGVRFSSKRAEREELASIALLVLKILVYIPIAD